MTSSLQESLFGPPHGELLQFGCHLYPWLSLSKKKFRSWLCLRSIVGSCPNNVSVFIYSTSQAGTLCTLLFPQTITPKLDVNIFQVLIKPQLSIKLLKVLSVWREYNYSIQFNYWTECPWQWNNKQASKSLFFFFLVREIAWNTHVIL